MLHSPQTEIREASSPAPSTNMRHAVQPAGSHRESASDYSRIVTMIGNNARVIVCRDGLQWILQKGKTSGPETRWRSLAYCRTRKALLRCVATLNPGFDTSQNLVLANLPERIEGGAK